MAALGLPSRPFDELTLARAARADIDEVAPDFTIIHPSLSTTMERDDECGVRARGGG